METNEALKAQPVNVIVTHEGTHNNDLIGAQESLIRKADDVIKKTKVDKSEIGRSLKLIKLERLRLLRSLSGIPESKESTVIPGDLLGTILTSGAASGVLKLDEEAESNLQKSVLTKQVIAKQQELLGIQQQRLRLQMEKARRDVEKQKKIIKKQDVIESAKKKSSESQNIWEKLSDLTKIDFDKTPNSHKKTKKHTPSSIQQTSTISPTTSKLSKSEKTYRTLLQKTQNNEEDNKKVNSDSECIILKKKINFPDAENFKKDSIVASKEEHCTKELLVLPDKDKTSSKRESKIRSDKVDTSIKSEKKGVSDINWANSKKDFNLVLKSETRELYNEGTDSKKENRDLLGNDDVNSNIGLNSMCDDINVDCKRELKVIHDSVATGSKKELKRIIDNSKKKSQKELTDNVENISKKQIKAVGNDEQINSQIQLKGMTNEYDSGSKKVLHDIVESKFKNDFKASSHKIGSTFKNEFECIPNLDADISKKIKNTSENKEKELQNKSKATQILNDNKGKKRSFLLSESPDKSGHKQEELIKQKKIKPLPNSNTKIIKEQAEKLSDSANRTVKEAQYIMDTDEPVSIINNTVLVKDNVKKHHSKMIDSYMQNDLDPVSYKSDKAFSSAKISKQKDKLHEKTDLSSSHTSTLYKQNTQSKDQTFSKVKLEKNTIVYEKPHRDNLDNEKAMVISQANDDDDDNFDCNKIDKVTKANFEEIQSNENILFNLIDKNDNDDTVKIAKNESESNSVENKVEFSDLFGNEDQDYRKKPTLPENTENSYYHMKPPPLPPLPLILRNTKPQAPLLPHPMKKPLLPTPPIFDNYHNPRLKKLTGPQERLKRLLSKQQELDRKADQLKQLAELSFELDLSEKPNLPNISGRLKRLAEMNYESEHMPHKKKRNAPLLKTPETELEKPSFDNFYDNSFRTKQPSPPYFPENTQWHPQFEENPANMSYNPSFNVHVDHQPQYAHTTNPQQSSDRKYVPPYTQTTNNQQHPADLNYEPPYTHMVTTQHTTDLSYVPPYTHLANPQDVSYNTPYSHSANTGEPYQPSLDSRMHNMDSRANFKDATNMPYGLRNMMRPALPFTKPNLNVQQHRLPGQAYRQPIDSRMESLQGYHSVPPVYQEETQLVKPWGQEEENKMGGSGSKPEDDMNKLLSRLVAAGVIGNNAPKTFKYQTEKKKVPDLTSFNINQLKVKYNWVKTELYSGELCTMCGIRMELSPLQYRQHLDEHFQKNSKLAEQTAIDKHRKWYLDIMDWLNYDPLAVVEDVDDAMEDASNEQSSNQKQNEHTCPASSSQNTDKCLVCKEGFDTYWNEEKDAWYLRNAFVDDHKQLFHPVCYEDYQNQLSRSNSFESPKIEKDDPTLETDLIPLIAESTSIVVEEKEKQDQMPDLSSSLFSHKDPCQPSDQDKQIKGLNLSGLKVEFVEASESAHEDIDTNHGAKMIKVKSENILATINNDSIKGNFDAVLTELKSDVDADVVDAEKMLIANSQSLRYADSPTLICDNKSPKQYEVSDVKVEYDAVVDQIVDASESVVEDDHVVMGVENEGKCNTNNNDENIVKENI